MLITCTAVLVADKALISRPCQTLANHRSIYPCMRPKRHSMYLFTLSVHCLSCLMLVLRTWVLVTTDPDALRL